MHILSRIGLLAFFLIAGSDAGARAGVVELDDQVSYTFQAPLVNGRGIKSLKDLEGRPVLVEFWGHR
jgi:hypothetical protein